MTRFSHLCNSSLNKHQTKWNISQRKGKIKSSRLPWTRNRSRMQLLSKEWTPWAFQWWCNQITDCPWTKCKWTPWCSSSQVHHSFSNQCSPNSRWWCHSTHLPWCTKCLCSTKLHLLLNFNNCSRCSSNIQASTLNNNYKLKCNSSNPLLNQRCSLRQNKEWLCLQDPLKLTSCSRPMTFALKYPRRFLICRCSNRTLSGLLNNKRLGVNSKATTDYARWDKK